MLKVDIKLTPFMIEYYIMKTFIPWCDEGSGTTQTNTRCIMHSGARATHPCPAEVEEEEPPGDRVRVLGGDSILDSYIRGFGGSSGDTEVCHNTTRDTVGWADQGTWVGPGPREGKD
jgi:hypothetical protein